MFLVFIVSLLQFFMRLVRNLKNLYAFAFDCSCFLNCSSRSNIKGTSAVCCNTSSGLDCNGILSYFYT